MSGGFYVLVTANIEINGSNFAYFDALIQCIHDARSFKNWFMR